MDFLILIVYYHLSVCMYDVCLCFFSIYFYFALMKRYFGYLCWPYIFFSVCMLIVIAWLSLNYIDSFREKLNYSETVH